MVPILCSGSGGWWEYGGCHVWAIPHPASPHHLVIYKESPPFLKSWFPCLFIPASLIPQEVFLSCSGPHMEAAEKIRAELGAKTTRRNHPSPDARQGPSCLHITMESWNLCGISPLRLSNPTIPPPLTSAPLHCGPKCHIHMYPHHPNAPNPLGLLPSGQCDGLSLSLLIPLSKCHSWYLRYMFFSPPHLSVLFSTQEKTLPHIQEAS